MPKLSTLSLLLNIVFGITLIAILANRSHPFEDPAELLRSMQMGWAIRGLAEHGIISKPTIDEFQTRCIMGQDYDKCREIEGSVVVEARAHFGITQPLPIPTPQNSQGIEKERP